MSEKVVKMQRKDEELQEAFVTLSNQVLALQDSVTLLNASLTAVVEMNQEGLPITKTGVQKRMEMVLNHMRQEWERMQVDVQ